MKLFKNDILASAYDLKSYNEGVKLYAGDNIKMLKIDDGSFLGYHLIEGIVNGDGHDIKVILGVSKTGKIYFGNCSCKKGQVCKHGIAILEKIKKIEINKLPYVYIAKDMVNKIEINKDVPEDLKRQLIAQKFATNKTHQFIKKYKNKVVNEVNYLKDGTKYQITTNLECEMGKYLLRFKVGDNYKYVIKDIELFLATIDSNSWCEYGKNLGFYHCKEAFSEEALKIIDLMRYACQNQKKSSYDTQQINCIYLNGMVDRIYRLYDEIECVNCNFDVFESNEKPELMVIKNDLCYEISLRIKRPYFLDHNFYYLKDSHLICQKLDESGIGVELIDYIIKNGVMKIAVDDFRDFYNYVLMPINDYFEIIDEGLFEGQIFEDEIKIYGDVIDNHLEFLVKGIQDNSQVQASVEEKMISYSSGRNIETSALIFELDDERTNIFLTEVLPSLSNYAKIFVSDDLAKLGKKVKYHFNVGIAVKNNLLSIDIDSIDIPKDEIERVLRDYRRKKQFHRLKDGRLLYLKSDDLAEVDQLLEDYHLSYKDIKNGHFKMPLYQMFSFDNKADESKLLEFKRSELFKDKINNFKQIKSNRYQLSSHYNLILRDYQKFGYQWLKTIADYGFGGILADEMGLGKTLQIIAMLDQSNGTSIVVVPASLLLNWVDEINKFSSTLKVLAINGAREVRIALINQINDYDVIITTYDYLKRDLDLYADICFEYIIIDEAQKIKNQNSENARAVKKLQGKHHFALTGTPIENSLAELWSIFDFLMPGYLFNYHYFKKNYEIPIVKYHDEHKQIQLKKLTMPFILRRLKADVLMELPEKIERTIKINFNEEEEKIYYANMAKINQELQVQLQMEQIDKIIILSMLTRLRQICCEPRILFDNIKTRSSKIEAAIDIIKSFQSNKQKVLLFSSFTTVLDLLEKELKKEKISFYTIVGKTSKNKRHQLVEQFQNDDTTVFLISLKAGGTGLNLTAAKGVIHFDPWWNMSVQNQATDRVHRIGQKDVVTVYSLVMKNSIEEKILELQAKKQELADIFVENNDISITSMSTEEIVELFKIDN